MNIKMSSSVFASVSRFAFKRAVGVGPPYLTCFFIHLSSQKNSVVFFTRQSLPSATYWLRLVVVTKLFFRFRSERQVDVAGWARGAADVVHRISVCLSFDQLIGKMIDCFLYRVCWEPCGGCS